MRIGEYEITYDDWLDLQDNPVVEQFFEELKSRRKQLEEVRGNPETSDRIARAAEFRIQGIQDALEVWEGFGALLKDDRAHEEFEMPISRIFSKLGGPSDNEIAQRMEELNFG